MIDNQTPFMDVPDLETERLLLRRLTGADADDMFAYASDADVARYTTWTPHESVEDSRDFIRRVMSEYEDFNRSSWTWGIYLKEESKIIGTLGIWGRSHFRAEVGYAIGKAYWGKGYVTEAVGAVLTYAFGTLELNRIEAECLPDNVASARVMEKCGMLYEGTMRERMFNKGQFVDLKLYAILRRDYDEQNRGS
jgi:[ribosomal protein S5]-alanine N-acetyltransferase